MMNGIETSALHQTQVQPEHYHLREILGDAKFQHALKKGRAFVAGSSILSLLMPQPSFKFADVDIFGFTAMQTVQEYFKNHPEYTYTLLPKYMNDAENYQRRLPFAAFSTYYSVTLKSNENVKFTIQQIYLWECEFTMEQVISSFDLGCCQCWFDGDGIYFNHAVFDLNKKYSAITREVDETDDVVSRENLNLRIEKYKARGITFNEAPERKISSSPLPCLAKCVSDAYSLRLCVLDTKMHCLTEMMENNQQ